MTGLITEKMVNGSSFECDSIFAYMRCYKLFFPQSMRWFSARDPCRQAGGRLVKILSEDMQMYLSKSLTKLPRAFLKDSYWFGATDLREEGTWKWADGSDMNYTAWATDQPNDHWSAGPKGWHKVVVIIVRDGIVNSVAD